jgi:hypothetical protein
LARIKRSVKGKINADREVLDSLKEKGSLLKKLEAEKEKNRLAHIDIEEEGRLRSQYMVQSEEERNMRIAAESNMRDYQKRAESSKGWITALQPELEIREKESRKWRSHYFEMEEELNKIQQER